MEGHLAGAAKMHASSFVLKKGEIEGCRVLLRAEKGVGVREGCGCVSDTAGVYFQCNAVFGRPTWQNLLGEAERVGGGQGAYRTLHEGGTGCFL